MYNSCKHTTQTDKAHTIAGGSNRSREGAEPPLAPSLYPLGPKRFEISLAV